MKPRKKRKAKFAEGLTLIALTEKQREFREKAEKRLKAKEERLKK